MATTGPSNIPYVAGDCPPVSWNFGLPEYFQNYQGTCKALPSFFGGEPNMPEAVGYALVVGFGAFFAVITSWIVWLEKRYVGTKQNSEWFNTAGRNVKTGLIAAVIVSQWTWAATILQSSNVAWLYGVAGPFWYAAGATIQVLLFGIIAIEIKRKAPNCHTVCEIILARWGKTAHIVFLVFCFLTNIIVTAMLLLGGSAVVYALTGMSVYVSSFLIPLGIVIYTLAGGLKATFIASYLNAVIIQIVLCIFLYLVYTSAPALGNPWAVYQKLIFSTSPERDCSLNFPDQQCGPTVGNKDGSFLTMLSLYGLIFGIINVIGNFGTVFVDNSYWMAAIAAKPSSTHKGYLLGGLIWFCIPFAMGTSMGLGSIALGLPVTATEAGQGLVPPATASALMGTGGGVLILTMLFMAVTSSGSSELVAVSTLITYDIYKTYFNPKATGKQILLVSRICVLAFGIFMGVLAILLNQAGVSLGWVYLAMGVIVGSAVIPIANVLLWSKANANGAIAGCCIGMVCGITTWLAYASSYGGVTLATTGKDFPMLAGNLVSILTGGAVHVVWSLIDPQNYNFEETKNIALIDDDGQDEVEPEEYDEEHLAKCKRWIIIWGCAWTVLIVILWPLLALPVGVFSAGYFTFWVIISITWGTIGSAIIILLPIYENWAGIYMVIEGLMSNDLIYEKMDDMDLKLSAMLACNPDAENHYRMKKEELKRLREDYDPPGLEHKKLAGDFSHRGGNNPVISEAEVKALDEGAVVQL